MRCPRCRSKQTKVRDEMEEKKDKLAIDIWRCHDCGEMWKKVYYFGLEPQKVEVPPSPPSIIPPPPQPITPSEEIDLLRRELEALKHKGKRK